MQAPPDRQQPEARREGEPLVTVLSAEYALKITLYPLLGLQAGQSTPPPYPLETGLHYVGNQGGPV